MIIHSYVYPSIIEMRQLTIVLIIVALMNNSDGQYVSCNDSEYSLVS